MGWLSRHPRWAAALVALAAFALYLPSLGYEFVYDSLVQVTVDDFIHQPGHLFDCLSLRVLGMDVLDGNRPLNLVSLIVDAWVWGVNPAGFRLTNLFLHAAVAGLLFRWLRILTENAGASLLAALFFALHPLHTETVVEVGYREDLLVAFFLLAGLNAAAAFKPGERVWGPGALAAGCFFLAAASKENGIAGPVALVAYWGLLRREPGKPWRPWAVLLAVTVAAVGAFYALRFALQPNPSVIFDHPPGPLAPTALDWLLRQPCIWVAELARVVWPAGLCADYGGYNLRHIDPLWAMLLIFALVIGAAGVFLVNRRAALGLVLAAAALLPVSNILPMYRPMADRYLYLPMTGLALLLAAALAGVGGRWRKVVWGGAALAAVALAGVTLRQQTFWHDRTALWRESARLNPYSVNAWLGQGDAAYDEGDPARALEFCRRANDAAHGTSALVFGCAALSWDALGEPEKAAEALRLATKLDSRFARPETLVRALVYPDYQARRFFIINQRAQSR